MSETTQLFTDDIGELLTFVTNGCKFCGRVTRLITKYGGEVVEEAGPHTIVLAPERSARQRTWTLSTFSDLCVQDCVKYKNLLPLKTYWAHRDPAHDHTINLNNLNNLSDNHRSSNLPPQ